MSSNDDLIPKLPPELEQSIFKLSLTLHREKRENPVRLFLVAKRVYEWLIPLYYDVVTISSSSWWPRYINEDTLKLYGHHVHHFHTSKPSGVHLLPFCPNVFDLAIWTTVPETDAEGISKLPITRVSIDLPAIFELNFDWDSFFANITHLDITNFIDNDMDEILSRFLVLTHIAVFDQDIENQMQTIIRRQAMNRVTPLKAIILLSSTSGEGLQEGSPYLDDVRVVRIGAGRSYLEDWWEGAYGGVDMWVFADEVIARRQVSGKMWTKLVSED